MKAGLIGLLILLGIIGCDASSPTPALPTPTFAPIALAQTTNAPTPTLDPSAPVAPQPTRSLAAPTPVSTLGAPAGAATGIATSTAAAAATTELQAPAVVSRFPLLELPGEGRGPGALTLLGENVFVANHSSKNIGVLAADHVTSFIALDASPSAIVSDPGTDTLIASSHETPALFKIQKNVIVKQVRAGGRVNALALDDDVLYVALDDGATIERYDVNTMTRRDELKLSQGFGMSDLVIDKPRNRLYAAIYGKIVALDLDAFQELYTLDVPYLYSGFAVNPSDGSIWSGAYDDQSSRAFVIGYSSEGQELARLFVGGDLRAAAFDDANNLYVLDRFNNQVHVIRTPEAQLVTTINVNRSPDDAIFDAARKLVWISNRESDNVTVVSAADHRVMATIPLANNITALAANATRNRVYAANASANMVYVIEGTRVVARAPTGNHPMDLAVDPASNRLYVANLADGTLDIIDENTLQITAGKFITRSLATVAADPVNGKLFAASTLLNPETLETESVFYAQGLTLGSQSTPQYERVDPARRKLYALASNGVPGSNSRVTLFRFLYDDLAQSKLLGSRNGGNTTAITIDPTTNHLFATNSHPLAYTHGLDVFDVEETIIQSIPLASTTTALAVNPGTHHLFLAHAQTYSPFETKLEPHDNTVEILDTRTLGHVGTLEVPNDPWRMTVLGDAVYVASYRDGAITLIRDAETAQPAAPTPTPTPSPYPTMTFTPVAAATGTPVPPSTVASAGAACAFEIDGAMQAQAEVVGRDRLGCPIANAETSDRFAFQPLETRGAFMFDDFRDANAKTVTVLFPDKTFREYADTWKEGDEERQCPDIEIKENTWRPKRGFGSVWCFEPQVQALGAGFVPERGVTVTIQEFERGKIWAIPDVGVFVLLNDGTWE